MCPCEAGRHARGCLCICHDGGDIDLNDERRRKADGGRVARLKLDTDLRTHGRSMTATARQRLSEVHTDRERDLRARRALALKWFGETDPYLPEHLRG